MNSSTLRALAKVCGKLVSRILVLRDATKLKARYSCKAYESQLARGSWVNLKIHENAISNYYHHQKIKKKE